NRAPAGGPAAVTATGAGAGAAAQAAASAAAASSSRHGTPLLVLHGSNLGTAEDLARQIAEEGEQRGFAVELASLDDFTGNLPAAGAVAIVSASYNGVAPDNAAGFWNWIKSTDASMTGVRFSVFGCGNRDWAATYQVVPRSIDERLDALGGERVHPRGEGDAREDMDGAFQAWSTALWPALAGSLKLKLDAEGPRAEPLLAFEIVPPAGVPSPAVAQGFTKLEVAINEELQNEVEGLAEARSTRHVEFMLPEGVTYRAGDHLSVAPRNGAALVERVMQRFGFAKDAYIRLRTTAGRKTFLPTDQPVSVIRLLGEFVELQDVASRKHIATLAEHTQCPFTKPKLLALVGTDEAASALYKAEVLQKRKSVFDLLEEFPAAQPPFEVVLEMLAPLAPRYYSISSSPEVDPQRCSLTVGVVKGAARSGQGDYEGVCSSHLSRLKPGETVHALVKEPTVQFRLPADAGKPVIMIGPGTGLAPFRGFLQERAAQQARGAALGDAMLFFGCRHPAQDFIYADQLKGWAASGVVDLHVAFSRDGDRKTYVQDLVREQGEKVWKLIEAGAVIFVCGDGSRMEPDVRRTLTEIARTIGRDTQYDSWIDRMARDQRYVTDVWTGS
ncbi:MAG: NADPH--cytochrome reductase, partial [Comamonadaceae bacterium]